MFRRLSVFIKKTKSDGFFTTLRWAFITAYLRIVPQRQVIWCVDLTKIDFENFVLPENIKIQRYSSEDQIDKKDLDALLNNESELMGSAGKILIRERFCKGANLWVLKENDIAAGYRWTIANNHVTPTYLPHTETDIHSFGLELFQGFRGRDLLKLFLTGSYSFFKNDGFKRCYLETHLYNKRALKAYLKMNFHKSGKIGVATRFKMLGKNIVIWHDMSTDVSKIVVD